MKVRGKLTSASGPVDFTGYRVRVRYRQQAQLPGAEDTPDASLVAPAETSVPADAAGQYEVVFDDALKPQGPFEFAVLAPDGRVLESSSFDETPEGNVDFRIRPLDPPQPATEPDSRAEAAQRLVGRLIDHLGGTSSTGDIAVVMFGRTTANSDFRPLAIFRTDPQGYFSGDRPLEKFADVAARVAIGGRPLELPVHLTDGQIPPRVLLVLPAPQEQPTPGEPAAPEHGACECDKPKPPLAANPEDVVNAVGTYTSDLGGACVQFTTPNRSIDEFTYYALVRTTDPDIKGLTLGPDRPLPKPLLDVLVKSAAVNQLSDGGARIAASALERDALDRGRVSRAAPGPDLLGRTAVDEADVRDVTTGPNRLRVSAQALAALATESDTFTVEDLTTAERLTTFRGVREALSVFRKPVPGRAPVSAANPLDWDEEPQFYQATTIAHGHLLHFKQVWRSNGYSLGDLLYSLPLAPGQKKQIVVLDWERREVAARQEAVVATEELQAELVRDRDINEIVKSTLKESARGASAAVTGGQGGVAGALTGAVVAVAGGLGFSGSGAWQSASRKFAAETSQHLRDQTLQSASAVRSQRSTVIQTAEQGETVRVTTEVVANHNHCHAITVQYFEVLRHLLVTQELADVQECLFVPLLMSKFDSPKALRWRDALARHLRNRALAGGFDALERIATNYANADFPTGRFEQETLEELDGDLRISFVLPRPRDKDDGDFDEAAWGWLVAGGLLWASPLEIFNLQLRARIDAERDRAWHREVAPRIAERFVQKLRFAIRTGGGSEINVALDTTLVSRYAPDVPLFVSVRPTGNVPGIARADVRYFVIRGTTALPPDARVVVESGQMRYRTAHLRYWLFRDTKIVNDLRSDDPDGVVVATPTDDRERRDPRKEDRELSRKLLAHLNEHFEYYHKALFWAMDPDRRYMLLDGFIAPNSGGRSVASVVENRLIGIVGNSLVMPVARGFRLDPTYAAASADELLAHYQPTTPIPAVQISVPTRGVFAEAVMGSCNSCEEIDNTRFWRWEESPIDEPTAITPISTESRRAEPPNLTPTPLPAPIVAMQTAPAAPDPTGLSAAIQLLGNPNLFRDFTGLTENQKNALAAMQSSLSSAQAVGSKLIDYAMQSKMTRDVDSVMKNIKKGVDEKLLTPEQGQQLAQDAIRSTIAGGSRSPEPLKAGDIGTILDSVSANDTDVKLQRPTGEMIETSSQDKGTATFDQALGTAQPWVTLQNNTPEARTFVPRGPFAVRNSGKSRLQADASFAPKGARFQWSVGRADALVFSAPTAAVTGIEAGSPGITSVTVELQDAAKTTLRTDTVDISVPQFYAIGESTGTMPTHRPGITDSHLFASVLREFQLTAERNHIVRLIRLVVEALMETVNGRTIWQIAPFNETLPPQFRAGQPAESHLAIVNIAGYPATTFFGSALSHDQAGVTHRSNAFGPSRGLQAQTLIFPGVLDLSALPETKKTIDAIKALDTQIAANPGNAALVQQRQQLIEFWREAFGRAVGVTTAHEMLHVMLGAAPGMDTGHTRMPDFDLLSPGGQFNFEKLTGTTITNSAAFPAAGSFIVHPLGNLPRLNDVNQSRLDVLFPVPPTPPFDR